MRQHSRESTGAPTSYVIQQAFDKSFRLFIADECEGCAFNTLFISMRVDEHAISCILLRVLLCERVTSMYFDIFVDSRVQSTRYIDARSSIRRRRGCTTYAHCTFCSLTHDLPSPSYFLILAIFLCLCRFCLSLSLSFSSPLGSMIYTSHGIISGYVLQTRRESTRIQGFTSKGE